MSIRMTDTNADGALEHLQREKCARDGEAEESGPGAEGHAGCVMAWR